MFNSDDKDRNNVHPDKLKNGLRDFGDEQEMEWLYMFLAKYVRKTHSDSEIKRQLKSNEGMSFLDLITPSDIAFVISVIKNARHVWDQHIRKIGLGEPLGDGESEATKVQPIFTKGTGKKKAQGKSLWSDEGIKYFKRAEKTWKKVYKDEKMMVDLYRGFDKWLNNYGRQMIVSKNSSKSLFSVVATWTAKDDVDNDNLAETEEVNPDDESEEDEEEGYCSDTGGNNTLSITLAREEKERTTRNGDGINNNNNNRRRMSAGVGSGNKSDNNNDDNDTTVLWGRQRERDRVEQLESPARNTRARVGRKSD
jgi:hypothetical protein